MDTQRTVNLYLDLETWAGNTKPTLNTIEAPANYKDPDKIQAYKVENLDKVYRKQALDSMKGEIICLCYAINDGAVVALTGTEEDILTQFDDMLGGYPWSIFIGHNILRFDLPWLFHRGVKFGLKSLKFIVPHAKNDMAMVRDTLNIFAGTAFGSDSWYSLDELAQFLGLDSKEFNGSEIHDLYLAGNINKIIEHCSYDVSLVRTIYKMTQ